MATTTNYGWTTPNDTDLVKNGASAIRTLGSSVDTTLGTALNNKLHAGLVLVKTQTIGTGVSSVTVTNAFSATYDNYKILISGGTCSTSRAELILKLGSSVTGYYQGLMYVSYPASSGISGQSNAAFWAWAGNALTNGLTANLELGAPFLTKYTSYSNITAQTDTWSGFASGVHQVAASHTDFTISVSGGPTITGGTIAVYGYAKD